MPTIQDIAVIVPQIMGQPNPIGEALTANDPIPASLLMSEERAKMLNRLEESISCLMNVAQNTYEANCGTPIDGDYITRLSTNEFFFYTKEPLTLKEFEDLQNKIANKAKKMSPGVQFIFGSFAVKKDDNCVMNVTPHISCGRSPTFHFVLKSFSSPVDVRYKIPDDAGGKTTLSFFDRPLDDPSMPEIDMPEIDMPKIEMPKIEMPKIEMPKIEMPKIEINGNTKEFTFNNIISCKTARGTSFITAIDICFDHSWAVAKKNYISLVEKDPTVLRQPVSHVVVSNCVHLNKNCCIGSDVMHVDPVRSLERCKGEVKQKEVDSYTQSFGNVGIKIFKVDRQQISRSLISVANTYAYKTRDSKSGRNHKRYTTKVENVQFKNNEDTDKLRDFKDKYRKYIGDHLKTQILEDLKKQIENIGSLDDLIKLKNELKKSYEVDVLKSGQGWTTQTFRLKTSSQQALEDMIEQKKEYLSNLNAPHKNLL